jgi:hypothetical protein
MNRDSSPDPQNFLLFEGGPFFRLLRKGLGEIRLEPRSIARTLAACVLVTWAPMAVLAALQGVALGPSRAESFLFDAAMFARFWVALPLLLLTADACGPRLQRLVHYFEDAELLREADREHFRANVESAMRACDSGKMELLLLGLAFLDGAYLVAVVFPGVPVSWRTAGPGGQLTLSWACWWLVLVSQPVYSFVVYRLLYRMLVWWKFLWRTSRLDLRLNASHPDGAGGLSFLGMSLSKFGFPAFALTASLAGGLANLVLHGEFKVEMYRYTVLFFVGIIVALFTGPLLFFYLQLKQTKVLGKLGYGWLSRRQLSRFEQKWVRDRGADEAILGAQDFSAVIDLSSTVGNVHSMRLLPFTYRELVPLISATLAPFLPVVALEIPVKEILKQLMKLMA